MKMDMLRFVGAESVDFPILGADPSGPFVLKGAEGLGPPEVTVRMARTVLEKAMFQGKSPMLRQITVVIGMQPNWDEGQTPEDLRETLYKLLTPRYGQMVRAEVVNGGVVQGFAQGHISKMEPVLFSKDPAVQIVLDCDYAYFLAPAEVVQQPAKLVVGGVQAFDVVNEGTAPAGFIAGFTLTDLPAGDSLILSDSDPRGMKIQVDGVPWAVNDMFLVDTRPGSRGVWRGAGLGGAPVSILNNLNASVSEWMYLYGGDNRLVLNVPAFNWNGWYNFRHQPAFWGV